MATGTTPLSGPTIALAELLASCTSWADWLTAATPSGQPAPLPADRIFRSDQHGEDRPFAEIFMEPGLRIERRQAGGKPGLSPFVASGGTLTLYFEVKRASSDFATLEDDMDAFAENVEAVLVELFTKCQPAGKPQLDFELAQPIARNAIDGQPSMGNTLKVAFRVGVVMP